MTVVGNLVPAELRGSANIITDRKNGRLAEKYTKKKAVTNNIAVVFRYQTGQDPRSSNKERQK